MKYLLAIIISLISVTRYGALPTIVRPWHKAIVFYEIDKSTLPLQVEFFKSAIETWHKETGVLFVHNPQAFNRIRVVDGSGCASLMGMVGGIQKLMLGSGCGLPTALHEVGHALGLPHEQQRYDRDRYVKINPECMEDLELGLMVNGEETPLVSIPSLVVTINFLKLPLGAAPSLGPYDATSIMQYDEYAFSKNLDCKTLTLLDSKKKSQWARKLSEMDIKRVKFMYYWSLKR